MGIPHLFFQNKEGNIYWIAQLLILTGLLWGVVYGLLYAAYFITGSQMPHWLHIVFISLCSFFCIVGLVAFITIKLGRQ